jgi:hypothetical protein
MSDPGVNYLIRDHASLLMAGRLAICTSTDRIFDTQPVHVVDRAEDHFGFRCPACGGRHDSRSAPTGDGARRMGYTVLQPTVRRAKPPRGLS